MYLTAGVEDFSNEQPLSYYHLNAILTIKPLWTFNDNVPQKLVSTSCAHGVQVVGWKVTTQAPGCTLASFHFGSTAGKAWHSHSLPQHLPRPLDVPWHDIVSCH